MKRKLFICGFTMILAFSAFITSTVALAASETITEEQVYTTTTENDAYPFESEMERNGTTYKLSNITYDTVSQKEVTKPETITIERSFEHLREQEVAQEIAMDQDGEQIMLQLTHVQFEPVTFPTGEMFTITGSTNFGYSPIRPDIPQTKEITYGHNDNKLVAKASLVDVVQEEYQWRDGYTIHGRYYGDTDCAYYQFENTQIPNTLDGSVPYMGYEDSILQSLGLSPNTYRINNATWDGEPIIENGVTVRNAIFHCSQYAARYVANYETTIPEQINGYNATATYSVEIEVPTGEIEYTVKAVAEYVEEERLPLTMITVGVVLLALIIIGILFLLRHRKRKEE